MISPAYFLSCIFSIFVVIMLLGDFGLAYLPWGASYYVFKSYPSGASIFFSDIYIVLLLLLPQLRARNITRISSFPWLKWCIYILILYALSIVYFYGASSLWHAINTPNINRDPGGVYSYPFVQLIIYLIFIFYLSYSCRVFGLSLSIVILLNYSNIIFTAMIFRDVMPRIMN